MWSALTHSGYDERWHRTRLLRTLRQLPELSPGHTFVDLGTHPAVLTVMDRLVGAGSVAGVTLTEDGNAFEIDGPNGETRTVHHVDIQKDPLPFPPGSVDYLTCFETLEHVLDPMHLLIEANRVLRPGGEIFLTTPNVLAWSVLVRSAIRRPPLHYPWLLPDRDTNRHNIEYTPEQVSRMLESAGFTPDVRTDRVWGRRVSRLRKALFVLAGVDPRGRGDIIFAHGMKTRTPTHRWDESVYALTPEQRATNRLDDVGP